MGLWNFLGGNKIGPGHPRYDRMMRKYNKAISERFQDICAGIMTFGMPDAIARDAWYDSQPEATQNDYIMILRKNPKCPLIYYRGDIKRPFGKSEEHIAKWKQGQSWLAKWNFDKKDVNELQVKIWEEQRHIEILDLQIERMKKRIKKIELDEELEKKQKEK